MKRIILFICLLGATTWSSAQQHNLGFGVRAGASSILGDIGSGDLARGFLYNMEINDTRWDFGLFSRYRFHPLFAVQGSFDWVRLQGEDTDSDNRARLGRNLNFTNNLVSLSGKFEFYPQVLSVADVGYRGRYQLDFQTYFFAGLGGAYHNPKTEYNGEKVSLRPLKTEGVSYTPITLTIPTGVGFFFTYKKIHRFGLEAGINFTATDYLDDISTVYVSPSEMSSDPLAPILANRYSGIGNVPDAIQYSPGSPRGDPTARDMYNTLTVSYCYLIRTRGSFYRKNYSWMYGRKKRWGGTKAKF